MQTVKQMYPQFRSLTTFRKVMDRIRAAGQRFGHQVLDPNWLFLALQRNGTAKKRFSFRLKKDWKENAKILRRTALVFRRECKKFRADRLRQRKKAFYQAMLSRDYKTISLCDDVIGIVFEYL
jgi:hypothetical protein